MLKGNAQASVLEALCISAGSPAHKASQGVTLVHRPGPHQHASGPMLADACRSADGHGQGHKHGALSVHAQAPADEACDVCYPCSIHI